VSSQPNPIGLDFILNINYVFFLKYSFLRNATSTHLHEISLLKTYLKSKYLSLFSIQNIKTMRVNFFFHIRSFRLLLTQPNTN